MGTMDNIDSLENRHLRGVGETMTRNVRPALGQMTRSIRTRLELNEDEEIGSPNELLDVRPFANAISKYFTGNPLASISTNKTRSPSCRTEGESPLLDRVV
jgi:DNA-directed RNA polymerase, beta subunit/140 kD subunit